MSLTDRLYETCLQSETAYSGHFLTIKRDQVRLPDGQSAVREYAIHPGAVMIIPLFDDGRVLLERQFRYPLDQVMIEFPAGKLDVGETTLACAQRELREETGYHAQHYTRLTRIHPVISYSTEYIDIYLATGLSAGPRQLDQGEFLDIFFASLDELLEWVKTGKVSDVKTMIGAFWLDKWIKETGNVDVVGPSLPL